MKIHALLILLALLRSAVGCLEEDFQSANRTWGQPANGLRSSISVENTRISNRGPFVVSLIVENISEAAINLETIFSFRIEPPKDPQDTGFHSGYWCPVDIAATKPDLSTGLIVAYHSRLVLEEGASISTTMDLSRHAWAIETSSIWPAKDFDAVVPKGKYILRLDITVLNGDSSKEIRSNEIEVVIEAPLQQSKRHRGAALQSPSGMSSGAQTLR